MVETLAVTRRIGMSNWMFSPTMTQFERFTRSLLARFMLRDPMMVLKLPDALAAAYPPRMVLSFPEKCWAVCVPRHVLVSPSKKNSIARVPMAMQLLALEMLAPAAYPSSTFLVPRESSCPLSTPTHTFSNPLTALNPLLDPM